MLDGDVAVKCVCYRVADPPFLCTMISAPWTARRNHFLGALDIGNADTDFVSGRIFPCRDHANFIARNSSHDIVFEIDRNQFEPVGAFGGWCQICLAVVRSEIETSL